MFIGLAIVCDDYFVPALDRIADGKWTAHLLKASRGLAEGFLGFLGSFWVFLDLFGSF